jgi:hypothetical protein
VAGGGRRVAGGGRRVAGGAWRVAGGAWRAALDTSTAGTSCAMCPFLWISPGLSVAFDRLEHVFDTAVACSFDARTGSAEEPPGLVLAARLDAADAGSLDDDDLLELVAGWERLAGWVRARQADASPCSPAARRRTRPGRMLRGVSARQRADGLAPDELSLRLGVTRRRAERMVRLARGGEAHRSDTVDALRAGTIDEAKAHLIVEALEHTAIPVALEVQDRVLPRAASRTLSQLSGDVQAALIDVDPRDAACRHAAAAGCDLDHTISFASGGNTSDGNLGALCRHHHLLKTHGGWGLEQPKTGAFVWTTPAGRVIRTADAAARSIETRNDRGRASPGSTDAGSDGGATAAGNETDADPPPF